MKQLICLFILCCFASLAVAQRTTNSDESISKAQEKSWLSVFEKRQAKYMNMLKLTDDQKRSLDTVNDAYVVQRAALFDENGLNRRDRKKEIKGLRVEREQKFRNLLSPEQLAKWEDFKKRHKKKVLPKK
jgi:Spy/CpxP family protein refolding chaperone